MKMFANIIFIFYTSILANLYNHHTGNEYQTEYVNYVHEIVSDFKQEVWRKYGLRCIGSGGSMPHDVESISVEFYRSNSFSSIKEARKLELELLQVLHKKVNQHEKIRPFLREYPFPISRCNVGIDVHNEARNNNQSTNQIVFLFQVKGNLFYCSYDGKKLIDLHKETYEEALKANEEYLEKLKKEKSLWL